MRLYQGEEEEEEEEEIKRRCVCQLRMAVYMLVNLLGYLCYKGRGIYFSLYLGNNNAGHDVLTID